MKTQDPPADGFALPDAGHVSEAVRAAQEKLAELRRERGLSADGRRPNEETTNYELRITNEESLPSAPLFPDIPAPRPYYSEPLSNHLQAAAARREQRRAAEDRDWLNELRVTSWELRVQKDGEPSPKFTQGEPPPNLSHRERDKNGHGLATSDERALNSSLVTRHSSLVKVYPDIALGMLRTKTAAAGRVWLLLRHHDAVGRGRVAVADAVRLLTGEGSPLRVCGRRQLSNLLRAGDGLYWQRDTDRAGCEWLRLGSAARVAAGLGVRRLAGSPVAVPLSALTGPMGDVRAHLYAGFHSGRTRVDALTGERRARGPIARMTLCKLSGAVPNSQRNYERRACVGRREAVALGPRLAAVDEHDFAWQRGRAIFHYHDKKGRHGRPGAVYLAWQLPNEYTGPHATLPRGRMKRLNRALADLFHDGMTGNGGRMTNDELRITNEEAIGGQYSVGSGQWPAGSRQKSMISGRATGAGVVDSLPRRFHGSAKAAYLSRGGDEKYWRCGGVWLWASDELRTTSDEFRFETTTKVQLSELVNRNS